MLCRMLTAKAPLKAKVPLSSFRRLQTLPPLYVARANPESKKAEAPPESMDHPEAQSKAQGESALEAQKAPGGRQLAGRSAMGLSPFLASPLSRMNQMMREMEREIESAFGLPRLGLTDTASNLWDLSPGAGIARGLAAVDVEEDDKSIKILADVPGLDRNDITIKVVGNTLVMSGQRSREEKSEEGGTRRVERSFGSFQRAFELPPYADLDKVKAKVDKGVLMVEIEKQASAEKGEKTIQIE